MGRSRKCNWKRKQLKANKKKGPVMLTGQQYWDLNTRSGSVSSDNPIFLIKKRRGGMTAAAIIDMMKNFNGKMTEKNFEEINYPYPYQEPEKLRGGAPNYYPIMRTADGRYIDPELGDIDPSRLAALYKEAMPALSPMSKRIGVPMVFGTAGSIDQSHWAHELWEKGIKDDAKYFIPAGSYTEESGPFLEVKPHWNWISPEPTVGKYFSSMLQKRQEFNMIAGADAANEESEIHVMSLSLSPLLEKMIAKQKRWRNVFFSGALPDDFFGYDPNGRNK